MKIVKHLPNAVTLCNLLCGCLAIVFAMEGVFYAAFIMILFGAFFDFCDGLTARALGAYSAIGKQLDSLSDLVTFGVAPAILALKFILYCNGGWLVYVPLIVALCSALRLAKFNIDEDQIESFLGLPTPASALLLSGLIVYLALYPYSGAEALLIEKWLVLAFSVILSVLMVSRIPMFSFKFKNVSLREYRTRFIFIIVAAVEVVVILLLGRFVASHGGAAPSSWFRSFVMLLSLGVFVVLLTYIIFNLIVDLFGWGREGEK